MTDHKIKSLYICYFGLHEPLVQNQVLPYLRELVKEGVTVSLLTFEKDPSNRWPKETAEIQREALREEGIDWHFLAYHKRFSVLATTYDVIRGAIFAARHASRNKTDILHARVHVPAVMAVLAKKMFPGKGPEVLFDIRGFFPEEYTDAGIWKENGLLYRSVKTVERWLLKNCGGFVVLTERARDILFPESKGTGLDAEGRPVEVIPCCVDLERFAAADETKRAEARKGLGIADSVFVAAYVGSFGGWYLTDETMRFFSALKASKPEVFAMILTKSDPQPVIGALKGFGYGEGDFFVGPVAPEDVPGRLAAADVAVSFIKHCYSKQASSPTKNAEYLACGLPVIINAGIGDSGVHVREDGTGVVIDDFSDETLRAAVAEVDELLGERSSLSARCRESAISRYHLQEIGGRGYVRIYRALLAKEACE